MIATVNADEKGIEDLRGTINTITSRRTNIVVELVRPHLSLLDVHPVAGKETEIEEVGGDLIALIVIVAGPAPAVEVPAEMEIPIISLLSPKKMA